MCSPYVAMLLFATPLFGQLKASAQNVLGISAGNAPSIVDAVRGRRAPLLIDAGFRRGSDIFKALAFGATAVALGRPRGLSGVRNRACPVRVRMLQTEVGRTMGACGKPNIKSIDPWVKFTRRKRMYVEVLATG